MKKFLNVLFNIFWVLIVGLSSAISSALMGVACMVTIVGIPFGLQHFKYIKLIFAPAGKKVVTKYGTHPVMNTLWLIFGGLELFLIYTLLASVLLFTIVGIPLAMQLFKIAEFNFAPFGAEIIGDDEYSSYRNTAHDIKLLCRRVVADPEKILMTDNEGNTVRTRDYLALKYEDYYQQIRDKRILSPKLFGNFGLIITFLCLFFSYYLLQPSSDDGNFIIQLIGMLLIAMSLVIVIIQSLSYMLDAYKYKKIAELFMELEQYYLAGSKQISERELQNLWIQYGAWTYVDVVYGELGFGANQNNK